jgi:hypothetical protein
VNDIGSTTGLIEQLERLLAAQRAQVRRRFLLHGLGWIAAAATGALLIYFVADRTLRLPVGVRLLASAAVLVFVGLGLRRRLLYPLRARIARDDVAVTYERLFPDLQERLISAVQLGDQLRGAPADAAAAPLRNQSEAMIARTIEQTAARIDALPARPLLNPRRTVRVWALAATLALVAGAGILGQPQVATAFLQRALGFDVPYPRETELLVKLPDDVPDFIIERRGRTTHVTMAAGNDLPVLVEVSGIPPQVPMTARGPARFRHMFRRVTGDFSFRAQGGDAETDAISVATLQPPQVASIRAVLEYPAYTGLAKVTQAGGNIEALEGTEVELLVTATTDASRARLVFLESGSEVPLETRTVEDDGGPHTVHAVTFLLTKSDRYQIELTSARGLQNPRPGTYPVVAIPDHAPIGRLLLPASEDLNVALPTAVLPLRLEVRDDYGIAEALALFKVGKEQKTGSLPLYSRAPTDAAPRRAVFTELVALATLPVADAKVSVGDTIAVAVRMTDIKQPAAMTTELPEREVFVVGDGDLARRIAGHFRRIREDVEQAYTLQEDRHDRLRDVLAELGASATQESVRGDLAIVQVGQARLSSLARRIRDELGRSFSVHLFNGLEASPHASSVQQIFLQYHRERDEAEGTLPGFWALIAERRRDGTLGSMPKTLDPILGMILASGNVADQLSPQAARLLDRAAVERSSREASAVLQEAAKAQEAILGELLGLRNRLDEWNEFQDVISQTRTLRDSQRDVHTRTQEALKGVGK